MQVYLKFTLIASFVCLSLLSGCKKEPVINDEADVTAFTFEPASSLASQAKINDKQITVQVVKGTDITKLKPVVTLSQGATVTPSMNETMDFTKPVAFTVVSENKLVQNSYTVTVVYPFESLAYHFENWRTNLIHPTEGDVMLKGEQPVEMNEQNEAIEFWASSNFGYGFLNDEDEKEEYPVKAVAGKEGKGVSLVTKEGLAMFGAPIIAGSLFSGTFDLKSMLGTPLKATHFGQPITTEPVEVKGYYAYKSGERFTDRENKVIEGRKDKGIISAIFYEVDDRFTHLDGTNIYTDPHIVSKGVLEVSDTEGDGYHAFTITLEYVDQAKKPDFTQKKYKFALVFASSADGGEFLGAIGSELKVDEIEVLTK